MEHDDGGGGGRRDRMLARHDCELDGDAGVDVASVPAGVRQTTEEPNLLAHGTDHPAGRDQYEDGSAG